MIVGLGIDVVDVERFSRTCETTIGLTERLFTELERTLPIQSRAARFAAKEAVIKAMGGPAGSWHDIEVRRTEGAAPEISFSGGVAARLAEMGADRAHVSLSHDGGVATAIVILERGD